MEVYFLDWGVGEEFLEGLFVIEGCGGRVEFPGGFVRSGGATAVRVKSETEGKGGRLENGYVPIEPLRLFCNL